MKQVDNHRIHAGIDGALNFLSSTAHKRTWTPVSVLH